MKTIVSALQNKSRMTRGAALLAALAVGGLVQPVLADPLNPLDFPSLGKVTLASGAYSINTTGAAPVLVGPGVNLTGTVSPSGVAVFRFDDLTVNTGAVISAGGGGVKSALPVALLASGDLRFAGTFDASGANGAKGSRNKSSAGGEGRFGGESGTVSRPEKPGGMPGSRPDAEPYVRLSGGGGGGGGLNTEAGMGGGGGGGGGGALELGALGALTLTGSALKVSGGNGGEAGGTEPGSKDTGSGAGGGGGGALLLHGTTVTLGGTLNALGGTGGNGNCPGIEGETGRIAIQATTNPPRDATGVSRREGTENLVVNLVTPALTPANLDFGSVPVGSSVTATMSIQNTGAPASVINGQFPPAGGPFARLGTGIFRGLKPTITPATCDYTFTPTSVGSFRQILQFRSNAGPVSVTVSGTGVKPGAPH